MIDLYVNGSSLLEGIIDYPKMDHCL